MMTEILHHLVFRIWVPFLPQSWQWKITLNERKLILEIHPFSTSMIMRGMVVDKKIHPRKLTAGGPQNYGLEKVTPFKYGHV